MDCGIYLERPPKISKGSRKSQCSSRDTLELIHVSEYRIHVLDSVVRVGMSKKGPLTIQSSPVK